MVDLMSTVLTGNVRLDLPSAAVSDYAALGKRVILRVGSRGM